MTDLNATPDQPIKRHVLIVDDRMGTLVDEETLFKNCGVDVEVKLVRFAFHAKEELDAWAAAGIRADIISCDDNELGQGDIGQLALENLLPYMRDTYGPEYVPTQYCVHSAGAANTRPIEGFREPLSLRGEEFREIETWGEEHGFRMTTRSCFENTTLREWCNEHLGTQFILTADAYAFHANPEKELSASSLYYLVQEGECTREEALARMKPDADTFVINTYLQSSFNERSAQFKDAVGRHAVGRLAFNAADIDTLIAQDRKAGIILCLSHYTPAIISQIRRVDGLILLGDGREHLKIVLENDDKPAILGFDAERTDRGTATVTMPDAGTLMFTTHRYNDSKQDFDTTNAALRAGDFVTIEAKHYTTYSSGSYGEDSQQDIVEGALYAVKIEMQDEHGFSREWLTDLADWADTETRKYGRLTVKANADHADAVTKAKAYGATGIGLVRTEHMLMADQGRDLLTAAFTTDDAATRQSALDTLAVHHAADLKTLFEAADPRNPDFSLTIRLLDAPLDEFLNDAQVADLTARLGTDHLRGCHLARKIDGLYAAQIKALFAAAREAGWDRPVDIMIPNVNSAEDIAPLRTLVQSLAGAQPFRLGAMIENLEAVKNASAIAAVSDFLSIGSNDLMSDIMGGVKRHDIDGIAGWMIDNKIRNDNPFKVVTAPLFDVMKQAVDAARAVRPAIEISVCGQQFGTDFKAAQSALKLGLDSMSVSPQFIYRARIHAGHYAVTANTDVSALPKAKVRAGVKLTGPSYDFD